MATTQNTYTGNGSTVLYSFTFPYLATTDIKVSVNGTNTTAYSLANATTIQFTAAPANGAAIRIFRTTDDAQTKATFFPGSSIRAQSLNDNFTQNLYVTQEANNVSAAATTTATGAVTTANTALSQSATAISTANTASTNASAAVTTSNAAAASAASAVTTANTSSTNSTAAVASANAAVATANSATTTANSSATQAATALSNSSTALTQSTSALSQSASALTASATASTNASAAVTTANTASTNASTAVTTANTANSKADQAIAVVGNSVLYSLVSNVAAIPASPSNNTAVEVYNSTGIESFTPLTGAPAGFVGSAGLSARIIYTTSGSTWNWVQYFPNDPETRYLKFSGGTLTGPLTLAGAPTSNLHPATKAYVDGYVSAINGDIGSLSSSKLDSTTAASTYQTQAGMSSYLTTATAGTTYQPLSGMSSYLTTANAASTYLTTATAGTTYQTQAGMSSYLTSSSASSTYAPLPTITTTATSKTLVNRERCTVTAAGQTITLPASPSAGWEVSITNASGGTDTIIARNSSNIMSLAENMTLDVANVTVTLYYVDATRGWRTI